MSKPANIKCEKCPCIIGQRNGDLFNIGGVLQRHKRSFFVKCPECKLWQAVKVNRNDSNAVNFSCKPSKFVV